MFICDECIKLCDIVVDPALTPEQAEAVAAPARGRADAVPTELLLVRLRFLNALFERQRADVEDTVNRLRQREVSWAAMGAAIGVSPQAAQDLFSRLSASSALRG